MKLIPAQITISRPRGSHDERGEAYINVAIEDRASGIQFVEARIRLADFAEALIGLSNVDCVMEVRGLQNVGKKREREPTRITISRDEYDRVIRGVEYNKHKKALASHLIANYSRPGWHMETYLGSQRSINLSPETVTINTAFYRFVELKEES